MRARYFVIGFLVVVLMGCSTLKPATVMQHETIVATKTAYIVDTDESSAEMELAVQKAMMQLGIATSNGPLASKPQDVDIYVKCVDTWMWDFHMYLTTLNVSVYDNATDQLIAAGGFNNRVFLHGYPDADQVAIDVVNSIFKKMN